MLQHLFQAKRITFRTSILPVVYFVALIPDNLAKEINELLNLLTQRFGIVYFAIVPVVLWGISLFKNKGKWERYRKIKNFLWILVGVSILTGCWDKVEIEDRAFIALIGIDKFQAASGTNRLYFPRKEMVSIRKIDIPFPMHTQYGDIHRK